jgi:hypothetical protein
MIKSVSDVPVYTLLSPENNIVYWVPPYQREYSWSKQQWDELFDDLLESDAVAGHFLGTIICVNQTENSTQEAVLELIDGQQRMTTLSLLLAAIYGTLRANKADLDDDERTDLSNLRRQLVLKQPVRARIRPQKQNFNHDDYLNVLKLAGVEIGKRAAISGGRVCTHHGGNAPAVKAKARQRIEEAADRMAKQLLGIATSAESEAVRLAAIRDALDRAGLVAPKTVDVAIAPKPWEIIFDDIAGGSRAESRRRRGIPDDEPDDLRTPALEAARPAGEGTEIEIVDAELVEPEPDHTDVRPASNSARSGRVGRKTYSLSDF